MVSQVSAGSFIRLDMQKELPSSPYATFLQLKKKLPCNLSELPTPCLLVDEEIVKKNCSLMLEKAAAAGVHLRPHVKTHKCHQIAKMQVGGDTSKGIVASTLPEVRCMAAHGFTDITYGVPVTARRLAPLLGICSDYPSTRLSILVDSQEQVDKIEDLYTEPIAAALIEQYRDFYNATLFGCFLKIDVGYHRAGVDVIADPSSAVAVARKIHASKALLFRGIYSHSGNAYAATNAEAIAISHSECTHAKNFADALKAANIPCECISVGSTPSCAAADTFPGATEIHPGNYVFFDRQQMAVPVCALEQVAVRVLTTVIGHYQTHILCDAGSLAISKDLAPQDSSFGSVEATDLLLTAVSQECGKLQTCSTLPKSRDNSANMIQEETRPPIHFDSYPRGSLLKIIPNHSCLTAACHPFYFVMRGQDVIDVWEPCRGW